MGSVHAVALLSAPLTGLGRSTEMCVRRLRSIGRSGGPMWRSDVEVIESSSL